MLPVLAVLIGVVMLLLSAGSQALLQETRHSSQNATLTPTPGHHPCFSTTSSLTTGRVRFNSASTVLNHLGSLKSFVRASIFFWRVEVAGGLRLIQCTAGNNYHSFVHPNITENMLGTFIYLNVNIVNWLEWIWVWFISCCSPEEEVRVCAECVGWVSD